MNMNMNDRQQTADSSMGPPCDVTMYVKVSANTFIINYRVNIKHIRSL